MSQHHNTLIASVLFMLCHAYNLAAKNLQVFGFQGYSPLSECDFCSVSSKLNFFVSSFTGASNARFDGMVYISVIFSTCLVYKIWNLRTFNFWIPRLYNPLSECDFCSVSSKLNFLFSSLTGASNARFDGMV